MRIEGSNPSIANPGAGRWRVAAILFIAALALRITLLFAAPNYNRLPPMEMERIARSFALKGELADPYVLPTGPTAHALPLYPLLLGSIYRVWGTGSAGQAAQGIFSCTLAALRCALLYPLVLFLGLGDRTAMLSSVLSCLYIPAFATEIRGGWDAPLTALFLMAIVCLAIRLMRNRNLTIRSAAACGAFLGLATLLSATLLAVAVGFLVLGAWHFRTQFWRYALWCTISLVVVALCLLPWGLRNRRELGEMVWLRSDLGFELWQAYHDHAGYGALDSNNLLGPASNVQSAEQVRILGEIRYNRMLKEDAVQWIRSHPARAAQLFLGHVFYFWFPPGQTPLIRLLRASLTLAAFAGLLLLLLDGAPAVYILAAVWVFFPLIYYVVYWSSRYRYPMEWTLLIAASSAIWSFWSACEKIVLPRSAGTVPLSRK